MVKDVILAGNVFATLENMDAIGNDFLWDNLSDGCGKSNQFSPPAPSFTNLVIQHGQTSMKSILAGIDEGIMVEDLLGLGQGNTISGAFSKPLVLSFKIEKSEILVRVKELSSNGNIYDVLNNIAAVSKEAQWVNSTNVAP